MENHMSIRVKAIPENESLARSTIAAFCLSSDPTVDAVNDVRTAVSEAVTNSIVHGYDGKEGDVLIEAQLTGDVLALEIVDYGVGIADVEMAMGDFFTTKEEEERSGLGFTIMRTFMDELSVESKIGVGTTVRMKKRLRNA
ncbi:MAG: anti-sigma F factor [Clostridia bacterium]|nr:anti-sigma F factor [Clostridia bacterium]